VKQSEIKDFFERERERMVNDQLIFRGISDESVLAAMAKVPREKFVLSEDIHLSYRDGPLPIGQHQTISQPYIVAYMTEAMDLNQDSTVLEIGTGSGYQTAVLAECVKHVTTIEIIPELAARSRHVLENTLNYKNITFFEGDAYDGCQVGKTFDRIILTAAPINVPDALFDQLAPGGKLLAPVGTVVQELVLFMKGRDSSWIREKLMDVRFVPLTGKTLQEKSGP